MDTSVREALIENFEHLIRAIELPDPDDRHVVAAAMHAGAELIITFNRKDFPDFELRKYNLSVQHPDDFIFDLLDLNAGLVLQAAARHRKSMKNPPKSVEDYLATMAAQGLTQTVSALRPLAWAL